MTDLLPPYHKPMTSELDCDLANDRVAALEAELERVKTGVVQTHMYRLPVLAIEVETGEQGVHWIDGLSAAEVFAVLRDDVPAPVYESIPKTVSKIWDYLEQRTEQAEAEAARLRCCGNCEHLCENNATLWPCSEGGWTKPIDPCHFTPSRWKEAER